ncbi:hypothetical protein D3C78_1464860 [compost metagenome]
MCKLLLNRNKLLPLADGRAKQLGQGGRHRDYISHLVHFRHPDNRVQRIVQKMRMNLRLQRLQLTNSLVLLLLHNLAHELLNLRRH